MKTENTTPDAPPRIVALSFTPSKALWIALDSGAVWCGLKKRMAFPLAPGERVVAMIADDEPCEGYVRKAYVNVAATIIQTKIAIATDRGRVLQADDFGSGKFDIRERANLNEKEPAA